MMLQLSVGCVEVVWYVRQCTDPAYVSKSSTETSVACFACCDAFGRICAVPPSAEAFAGALCLPEAAEAFSISGPLHVNYRQA